MLCSELECQWIGIRAASVSTDGVTFAPLKSTQSNSQHLVRVAIARLMIRYEVAKMNALGPWVLWDTAATDGVGS